MRLLREAARLLLAFSLLTSAAPANAQNAWVLWRHFVPADNPEANHARLWQPEPKTTRVDSTGRTYRIEYRCLPDTVEPRGPKGK
jgi:hypothetical protein